MRIGLLSDTHAFLDEQVLFYFENCDEIWHAGDIGSLAVADALQAAKPLRAVFGNIDDAALRAQFPENLLFQCEGIRVLITHIGGFPPRYNPRARKLLDTHRPRIFICGHSHILKVVHDDARNILHINPGAAGNHGFHIEKTIVRFEIDNTRIHNLQVIELGKRGK